MLDRLMMCRRGARENSRSPEGETKALCLYNKIVFHSIVKLVFTAFGPVACIVLFILRAKDLGERQLRARKVSLGSRYARFFFSNIYQT